MPPSDLNNEQGNSFTSTKSQRVAHHEAIVYPRNSYTIERSYCEVVQKNKPACNSVIGGEMVSCDWSNLIFLFFQFTGIFLLMVGGLHAGWGVWRIEVREPWLSFTNLNMIIFIMMSWYMFAVIGGLMGAVLVTKLRKKVIYVSKLNEKNQIKNSLKSVSNIFLF